MCVRVYVLFFSLTDVVFMFVVLCSLSAIERKNSRSKKERGCESVKQNYKGTKRCEMMQIVRTRKFCHQFTFVVLFPFASVCVNVFCSSDTLAVDVGLNLKSLLEN